MYHKTMSQDSASFKNESSSDEVKIKVFLIKNAHFNTKSLELYLERRDFNVISESEPLSEENNILKKIADFSPNYILLAWDHKDANIRSLITLIGSDIPCIPYITSTSTQDARALMVLNNPYKLFPPISGPSIQRMILKIEKSKTQKLQQSSLGVSKKNESQVFVAKGKRAGDLQKDYQRVLGGHARSNIHLHQDSNSMVYLPEHHSAFDSITDLTTPVPISQFSPRMNLKISEFQKKSLAHKFDSKIESHLKNLIQTLKTSHLANKVDLDESIEQPCLYGLLLQSIDSSGLIIFYSEWKIDMDEAELFIQDWSQDILSHFLKGEHINQNNYQSQVFEINVPLQLNILEICQKKSAVHKSINIENKSSLMAFFDLKHNPFNIETALDDNYFIIDPECLVVPSTLPVDLYYELKQNKKMIKIFKTNSDITEKEIEHIHQKKLLPLLVDSSDEITWYKYGVESFLKK